MKSLKNVIIGVNAVLIFISCSTVLARFYVRSVMLKALGWDDLLVAIALASVITISSLEFAGAATGAGSHVWTLSVDQLHGYFSLLPVNQLVVFVAGGLVRLSILAFLPRLCKERWYMRCVWVTGAAIAINTIVSVLFAILHCQPIGSLYNPKNPNMKCLGDTDRLNMIWAHTIIATVLDAVLFILPIWMVRRTMVFDPKAIKVMVIFCIGAVAIIAGIVKTVVLMTADFSQDGTYKAARACLASVIELHVGFWCGNFPAMQPLLRSLHRRLRSPGCSTTDSSRKLRGSGSEESGHSGTTEAQVHSFVEEAKYMKPS